MTEVTPYPDELARSARYVAVAPVPFPLVVGLTGAHMYGFPSPDSDLDLKAIHVAPTLDLAGLEPVNETIERVLEFEGQEVDFTSHEVGMALRLLLKGNGNMLERVLTPYQVVRSPLQEEITQLAREGVSRQFFPHYRGFFHQKAREIRKGDVIQVKSLCYAYRVALTGIHLLETGELIGDLTRLAPLHGYEQALALVDRKRSGREKDALAGDFRFEADFARLEERLTRAHDTSPLPETAPNRAAFAEFIRRLRHRFL